MSNNRLILIFFCIVLAIICSNLASAGTISISTTITTTVNDNRLTGTIEVTNKGDSVANNVKPIYYIDGEEFSGDEIKSLKPEGKHKWQFVQDLDIENPGSYPLILEILYKDDNKYPFSAITLTTYNFKRSSISDLDIALSRISLAGSAEIPYSIGYNIVNERQGINDNKSNMDGPTDDQETTGQDLETVDVYLTPVLPINIDSKDKNKQIRIDQLESGKKYEDTFSVKKGSALVGSNYNVYLVAEYDLDGIHYTKIGQTSVSIINKENIFYKNSFYYSIIGILIILGIIFWKKRPGKKVLISLEIIGLLLLFIFVLSYLKPSLLFLDTTITGGDTGSHVVLAHHLKEELLPNGKLAGWYPNWMAGLPLLQFYFIPPYLLIVILSYVIPFNIAFKLVTVSGILFFPIATYIGLRLMKYKYPIPFVGAVSSLILLFDESFSRWGGNIKSTFAGQFPHMISFCLLMIAMGLAYHYYTARKGHIRNEKKYLAWTIIIVALMMTTHIYTTIILSLVTTFFFFHSIFTKKFYSFLKLGLLMSVSGLLASFWIVPMFAKLGWTSAPKDVVYGFPMINAIFSEFYIALLPLCLFGIFLERKKLSTWFLTYSFFIVLAMTILSRYTSFLYIRFISFLYIIMLILAAIGIGSLVKKIRLNYIVAGLILVGMAFFILNTTNDIQSWTSWNYEGLEKKTSYPLLDQVLDKIREADTDGRVNIEYANYNYFGTPRVFETSPIFTGKPVIEALTVESSLTFPYHYYIQKEITKTAWWPTFPLAIPTVNLTQAAYDMALYNVKYFVSSNNDTQDLIEKTGLYEPDGEIQNFKFYYLNQDSDYVKPLDREPILIVTDDITQFTYPWISSEDKDIFFAFSSSLTEEDMVNFRLIVLNKSVNIPDTASNRKFYSLDEAKLESSLFDLKSEDCEFSTTMHTDSLEYQTSCPKQPHLIKISYFPNWESIDKEKLYPAAPSLMIVFPDSEDNRLYYGTHWSDRLGWIMTIIGLFILKLIILQKNKKVHLSTNRFLKNTAKLFRLKKIEKYLLSIRWQKLLLGLFLLMLLVLLVFKIQDFQSEKKGCMSSCTRGGLDYSSGTANLKIIDRFNMGYISYRIKNMISIVQENSATRLVAILSMQITRTLPLT